MKKRQAVFYTYPPQSIIQTFKAILALWNKNCFIFKKMFLYNYPHAAVQNPSLAIASDIIENCLFKPPNIPSTKDDAISPAANKNSPLIPSKNILETTLTKP